MSARYGIIVVAESHTEGLDEAAPVLSLAHKSATALLPRMSIKEAMKIFDQTESDMLAVVDALDTGRLLCALQESCATRRYAEEMEKAQHISLRRARISLFS